MGSLLPGWDNDALDAKPGARVRQGEAPPEPARDGAPALRAAEELRREKERLERLERLAAAAPHSASRAPPYSPETTASLLRDMDLAAWGRALGEARRSAGLGRAAFDHDSCSAVDHAAVASVAAAANLRPPTRRSDRADTLNPAAAERLRARLERLSRDRRSGAPPAADEDAEISAEIPAAGPRLDVRRRLVVRARLLVVDARAPAEESVVRVVLTVVRGDDAFATAEVDREALVGVVNEAFRRRERALACGDDDDDDSVDAPRRRFFSDDDDDAEKSPQRRTSWWGRTESAHLNRPTDETGTLLGGGRVLGRSGSEVGADRRRASARLSDEGPGGAREAAEDGGAARGGKRGGPPATPTRGREGRRGGRGASFVPQFMKSWEGESEGGAE
jgi:hypothetical protein